MFREFREFGLLYFLAGFLSVVWILIVAKEILADPWDFLFVKGSLLAFALFGLVKHVQQQKRLREQRLHDFIKNNSNE